MRTLIADLRVALRSLRKSPGVTTVVALTLAMGIGASTAIFSVIDAVLLRSLPFERPDELVRITADYAKMSVFDVGLSVPELMEYRELTDSFELISGFFPISINLTEVDEPERIEAALVDVNYFALLGVEAQIGRVFRSEDYRSGIGEVAVISDGLWKRRFGGDPGVIGRKFRLDEDLFSVVGVAPAGFRHARTTETDLWVPSGWLDTPFPNPPLRRAYFFRGALARLKSGVTASSAEERLHALAAELRRQYPADYPESSGWIPRVAPLLEDLTGGVRPLLLVMFAAVGVILLMVCANVASLMLARGAARTRELALRRALGATGFALARQLLVESVVLISVSFGLALIVGMFGVELLIRSSPTTLPRLTEVTMDGRVVTFAALVSMASGLLFGSAPAFHTSRVNVLPGLKEAPHRNRARAPSHLRSALVVLEYSLAVVVLVGSLLLGRSLSRLLSVEPGFDPKNVFTARLWLPQPNQPEDGPYFRQEQRVLLFREMLEHLSVVPGVESVAITSLLPLDGERPMRRFEIEGRPAEAGDIPAAISAFVSRRYFDTMRIPLLRGRVFDDGDDENGAPVVVVSQSLAEQFFPGEDSLGRRIRPAGFRQTEAPWRTIVGVVSDVRVEGLELHPRPLLYVPLFQESGLSLAFVVRSHGRAAGLGESLRAVVDAADPDLPLYAARTMEDVVRRGIGERRFATSLTALFSTVALLLAGLGVYGVTSYSVRLRTREIGIRVALGAEPRRLVRLVLRQGMALFGLGAALGLAGSIAASSFLRSLLFEVELSDPTTYVAVILILSLSALVACLLPARRASSMDPLIALRYE